MRDFHKLENWNKDRDVLRRLMAVKNLCQAGIKYTCPSKGHFKIESKKCITLMFYPKTGTIVWRTHKNDFQHKFINEDAGRLINKLKELI